MKTQLNYWFYIPFVLFLIAGAIVLLSIEKGQDVLYINSLHAPFFDSLFYYGTTLGNGLLYLAVGIALTVKNYRHALIALLCFAITGLLVQLLKVTVFSEVMRPSVFLANESLHFVEGVKILKRYSFPSGHSATAFSMFSLLSLMIKESKWALAFLLMAFIGGISRIYLAQHFFVDVYFGAIIGVTVTTSVWMWFVKTNALYHWNDKSIRVLQRKP